MIILKKFIATIIIISVCFIIIFVSELQGSSRIDNFKLQIQDLENKAPKDSLKKENEAISFVELFDYKNSNMKFTQADSRYLNPWQWKLLVELPLDMYYGLEISYFLSSNLAVGMDAKTFITYSKLYTGSTVINAIDPNNPTKIKLVANNFFIHTSLFLRWFPFQDSGFFLQANYIVDYWKMNSKINAPDINNTALNIASKNLSDASITPGIGYSLNMGFNLVSQFGFSHMIGLGYSFYQDPKIEYKVYTTSSGANMLTGSELDSISKSIKQKMVLLNRGLFVFLGAGSSF